MDKRLVVNNEPREGVWDGLADLPLFTIVWRAKQAEFSVLKDERQREGKVLAQIAEATGKLRAGAHRISREPVQDEDVNLSGEFLRVADIIEESLTDLKLEIYSPVGEEYTSGLMELFDNIAQIPSPDITVPVVAEVIQPAILYRGSLLTMGKTIISVPGESAEAEKSEEDEE